MTGPSFRRCNLTCKRNGREREQLQPRGAWHRGMADGSGVGSAPEDDPGPLVGDKANIAALAQAVGAREVAPQSARAVLVSAFRLSEARRCRDCPR